MEIFQICALVIFAAVLCRCIERYQKEYSLVLALAAAAVALAVIFAGFVPAVQQFMQAVQQIQGDTAWAQVLLKAAGVALLCRITAGACKDAGENTLCFVAELAAKCAVFLLCVPLFTQILQYIVQLIGLA